MTPRERSIDDPALEIRRLQQCLAAQEAEANVTHKHLRLLVEHTPAAVAILDDEMRYLVASRRWLEEYGLAEADCIGRSHYDVFPGTPEPFKEHHRRCLAGEHVRADEDLLRRRDGRLEWVRWELLPWRRSDGQVGGMIMFTEDITARKTAEIALLESHKELESRVAARTRALEAAKADADRANAFKSRFVAAVNHDLRQPLYAGGTYLTLLGRQLQDPKQVDLLQKTQLSLAAMADMLDALLDLSQLERGTIKPNVCDFSVASLLNRVVINNALQAEQKGLDLQVRAFDCTVRSDPALLERVLDNLVSNAVSYTEAGEIIVECERQGQAVRIAVRDTGVGIPAEALQDIFEAYVQLDNPARERNKGLGLGLSIAKYVADALGHALDVTSKVGEGSTFSISVPHVAAPPAQTVVARPAPAADPGRRPVALVIEDDAMISLSTLMLFEDEGFEAHEASDGEQALHLVSGGLRPDILVSDYRLPNYDGFEVIRRVRRALSAAAPAIVVTGDTAVQAAPADLAVCEVLHKPVMPERLLFVVKRLVAGGGEGAEG